MPDAVGRCRARTGVNTQGSHFIHVHVAHPDGEAKFWLLLDGEELLVPFAGFPWFKKATIEQLTDVEWPSQNHLYWPQLDIDLAVESIRHPDAFPLVARSDG